MRKVLKKLFTLTILASLILSPTFLNAGTKKTLRIAVIDSGYTITEYSEAELCDDGHKDLTNTTIKDRHGHGTHIVNTLVANLDVNVKYCIILVKWYDPYINKFKTIDTSRSAFEYLLTQKVDIINYSAGGSAKNEQEKKHITELLKRGVKIFVAAGNDGNNLNKDCYYYPACYDIGLEVVGNWDKNKVRHESSNYGKIVTRWENGVDVIQDTGYNGQIAMTGTSQATAIASAKEANRRSK